MYYRILPASSQNLVLFSLFPHHINNIRTVTQQLPKHTNVWAPLIEEAASFFKTNNFMCKQQYSEPTAEVLNKIWYLCQYSSAAAELLDGKEAFKVKFQVLFPSAARDELNYEPGTIRNWPHADR